MSYETARADIRDTLATVKLENLIENPSFETNDAGITVEGTLTKALDTTQKHVGAQSLKVTGGSGSSKNLWVTKVDGTRFPVTADEIYNWSLFLKPGPGQTTPLVRLVMEWFDAGGASVQTINGGTLGIAQNSDWTRQSLAKIAPSTAATVRVGVEEVLNWSASRDLYFDALMLSKGPQIAYIDGDQPGCAWDVAPHAGTSRRPIKKVYEDPPGTIQDRPCFMMMGSAGTAQWMAGEGSTEEEHTEQVVLATKDADIDKSWEMVRAYRSAILAAFKTHSGLGGAGVITDLIWERPGAFEWGGIDYFGQKFLIRFQVSAP